jgi:hypothetical protein
MRDKRRSLFAELLSEKIRRDILQWLAIMARGPRSEKEREERSGIVKAEGRLRAHFVLYVGIPSFAPICLELNLVLNPRRLLSPFGLQSPTGTSRISPPLLR